MKRHSLVFLLAVFAVLNLLFFAMCGETQGADPPSVTPVVMPITVEPITEVASNPVCPVEGCPAATASSSSINVRVGDGGKVWRGYEAATTVCGTTTPRNRAVRRGNACANATSQADIPVSRRGRLRLGVPVRNIARGVITPRKKVRLIRMNGKRT